MLTDRDRDYLTELAATRSAHADQLAATDELRDNAIRDALDHGSKPTELGRIFGLSRERIYQIRDRRR